MMLPYKVNKIYFPCKKILQNISKHIKYLGIKLTKDMHDYIFKISNQIFIKEI